MSSDIFVVFTKDDGHWWSRFLHKDIQHCFVIKPNGADYLVHGRTVDKFDLFTVTDKNVILSEPFRIMGYKQKHPVRSLFMLNTCVGHTKQLLGINRTFIWTPYQLYKYMRNNHGIYEGTQGS